MILTYLVTGPLDTAAAAAATAGQVVRKKVMEILGHVNKRLKGSPATRLPLTELLALAAQEGESGGGGGSQGREGLMAGALALTSPSLVV